jgi:cytochrome c-type biogenesis protein CcmE
MKPKHQRLVFVVISMACLTVSVLLIMRTFRDNLVFFYSPSDIAAQAVAPERLIRIGGLVEAGSMKRGENGLLEFELSDGKASIHVRYQGMLPALFREGQGVVAEGYLADATHFQAKTILAKHDERYMPAEVVDALKRSGRWKGQ